MNRIRNRFLPRFGREYFITCERKIWKWNIMCGIMRLICNFLFSFIFYIDNILLDYIFYYGNIKSLYIKIFKF